MTDVPEYEANIKRFNDAHNHLVSATDALVFAQGELRHIKATKDITLAVEYLKSTVAAIEKMIVEQIDSLDELADAYDDANKPEGYDEGVA